MAVEFKQATLDNGLTIIGECNDQAHTAAIGFFVRTGSRDEPKPLMGVSHFLEHMMFKGTDRRTADDVNREFDEIGANYNAMTGQESTIFYAHVLPEKLPRAVDLLSDILRPSLRDEDFEVERNVILEEIGMYADRPFWVVMEQAIEDYFGEHPLAYRILGTEETIRSMSAEQMREYFAAHYSPDNIVVSLAGRVDFDAAVKQLAEGCGRWERREVRRDLTVPTPHPGQQTLRKGAAKMHYYFGLTPAPSAQDEQRYAAAVLAHVLGDAEGSRLYWRLIDPGLADEAELSHHGFDHAGTFVFFASCDPARADEVETIVHEVLDGAADELTEEEVERAASKMAMEMTLGSERPPGRMMALGGQWLYLGRRVSLEEELERVRSVTPDDLRRLLAAYSLQPRTAVRLTPGEQR